MAETIKIEKLLEWVANELYIARKEKECATGEALIAWESQRKRIEEKIEAIRGGL